MISKDGISRIAKTKAGILNRNLQGRRGVLMKAMNKYGWVVVVAAGIVLAAAVCLLRFGGFDKPKTELPDLSSELVETLKVTKLSVAEFNYKGTAEVRTKENPEEVLCHVGYSAAVTAEVDLKQVQVDDIAVDHTNRSVTVDLPDITLKATLESGSALEKLPSDADAGLSDLLRCSLEDAERKAKETPEILQAAEENLRTTVEAVLLPFLKDRGYALLLK